ncbi:MAG: FadR/GntR family transcriptional regulator [Intestinibacter bartlettii]|uniref:FadR/GntR family transcriptional regulator n=1 Tax=Intestinibacter bartlettii TaxID=261299 RepID=UPI0026F120B0|nr:FadR/GntR family transcriptional regulator [Intestinibacter bartlettii]MDO5011109.1 FadR/GntR family transcriptional regulator [Intestinibacter bartlettii]
MEHKKAQSLPEKAADEILDMIVTKKQFSIGDKLPNETELSSLLNVSRTTLREAIKMLVLQDIVEIKRGKGTFVKRNEIDNFTLGNLKGNSSDLADLLEMRLVIEPMGAYYATKRATDDEIKKIIEYGESVEQKILNNEDRTDAEQLFHNAIAKASGNSFMKELVPIISKAINESVIMSKQYEKATELTLKDHRLIMDFMKERNAEGAKTAMSLHIIHTIDSFGFNDRLV